jgi:hypothetical protein
VGANGQIYLVAIKHLRPALGNAGDVEDEHSIRHWVRHPCEAQSARLLQVPACVHMHETRSHSATGWALHAEHKSVLPSACGRDPSALLAALGGLVRTKNWSNAPMSAAVCASSAHSACACRHALGRHKAGAGRPPMPAARDLGLLCASSAVHDVRNSFG